MSSKLKSRELPTDRIATSDKEGKRIYLYPADVKGKWRQWRVKLRAVLVIFFLFLPWLKINGHQAVLLDIPQRRFAIFGLTFWAHDAPMILFVLVGLVLAIVLVTALWGRLWCGWACPQTVFIEAVFRRIERWIEGDSVERKQLDEGPWNENKVFKKTIKWILFLLVSLIITHSFIAYFVGTEKLLEMIRRPPFENPTTFLTVMGVTTLILFDFGWFREQFCVIACPYGRFQSILMDPHSLAIVYDEKRGEPRRGSVPEASKEGDCVNCYRCVQVCPTGVDIRRGLQLECIACTACIDACDEVMHRLEKPKGLIRYDTLSGLSGKAVKWLRPRSIIYFVLFITFILSFTYVIRHRELVSIEILRAKETPYQQSEVNGQAYVINHFRIDFANQSFHPLSYRVEMPLVWKEKGVELVMPLNPVSLPEGKSLKADFFVKFPKSLLVSGHAKIEVKLNPEANPEKLKPETKELPLVGPFL